MNNFSKRIIKSEMKQEVLGYDWGSDRVTYLAN